MPASLDIITDLFLDQYDYEYIDKEIPFTETANDKIADLKLYLRAKDFTIILLIQKTGLSREEVNRIIRELSQQYRDFALFITDEKREKVTVHKSIKIEKDDKEYRTFKEMIYDPLAKNTKLFLEKVKNFDASCDSITTIELNQRIDNSLQTEKVTKKFYAEFQKYHKKFIGFIEGITETVDCQWYASLMMNRLMFTYFIQKKGFLDGDEKYLINRLDRVKDSMGKDKFYTFYREFLLVLFHKGFSAKPGERTGKINELIGRVPYLNGGLFDVHELECRYQNIKIPDSAFQELFNFFEKYTWYLDDRPVRSDDEINPDVLGFIFEKYINQKQMGAFYTKEDITEYISKNTIIPFLFAAVEEKYPTPFKSDGAIWNYLRLSSDNYIYDAVKKGCNLELPEEICKGLDTTKPDLIERRKNWNSQADEEYALPSEIWRETIERRKNYYYIKQKIEAGDLISINDLITYNLDIRSFIRDTLLETNDERLIREFYNILNTITVLDPTCGSGAFLFAASNILEPLYEVCLERMREFITDKSSKRKYLNEFRRKIDEVKEHPNEKYYIFKSIIINNLYGVDIMKEAVEIAKLRLFLKLASCANYDESDSNLGLEPLPDIDFNIKAGNTLVGFASFKELDETIGKSFDFNNNKQRFRDIAKKIGLAGRRFRESQVIENQGSDEYHKSKNELSELLKGLNSELDIYLAGEYAIDETHITNKKKLQQEIIKWQESHQPFHWVSEFYEIIEEKGGFDIIIGNPPYVEYSKVKTFYHVKSFQTIECGNIYVFVIENCTLILQSRGRMGMIVQNSIVCTKRMKEIQNLLQSRFQMYYSNYDDRPAKLFTGLNHMKGTIFLTTPLQNNGISIYSTKFFRWYEESRNQLFETLQYCKIPQELIFDGHIPKITSKQHLDIFIKLYQKKSLRLSLKSTGNIIYCHRIASYFIKAIDFVPYFYNEKEGQKKSDDYKPYFVTDNKKMKVLLSVLNSGIFYLNWHTLHDGYHCGKQNIEDYPFDFLVEKSNEEKLIQQATKISKDYLSNSYRRETVYKNTGTVIYDEFYPKKSKPIIDEIDMILAIYYGFTEAELDFIINYDIKYRMGKELDDDSDEE